MLSAETKRFELLKAIKPYLVSSEAHSTGLCDVSIFLVVSYIVPLLLKPCQIHSSYLTIFTVQSIYLITFSSSIVLYYLRA